MNIKFGDKNYFVRYIQAFLNKYYSTTLIINGTYDVKTHKALKQYLNIPVSVSHNEFPELIINRFNTNISINNKLTNIHPLSYWFKFKIGYEQVEFTCKSHKENDDIVKWMVNSMTDLSDYASTIGWEMYEFNSYDPPYSIKFKTNGYSYEFPRDKVMCTVNLFEGQFQYNKAIRDGEGKDDTVHSSLSGNYKISVIECDPNSVYTIYTASTLPTNIVIGYSIASKEDDLEILPLNNVQAISLNPNEQLIYNTYDDAKFLVIQVPSSGLDNVINYNDDAFNIKDLLILKGDYSNTVDKDGNIISTFNIPSSEYISDPWILNDKFLAYICKRSITPCSESSDIFKVQKLISELYPINYEIVNPGSYDIDLQNIIKNIQIEKSTSFILGYVDTETESLLVRMAEERGLKYE